MIQFVTQLDPQTLEVTFPTFESGSLLLKGHSLNHLVDTVAGSEIPRSTTVLDV